MDSEVESRGSVLFVYFDEKDSDFSKSVNTA